MTRSPNPRPRAVVPAVSPLYLAAGTHIRTVRVFTDAEPVYSSFDGLAHRTCAEWLGFPPVHAIEPGRVG